MPPVEVPATEAFFVGGKGTSSDNYRIVGSSTSPYSTFTAADAAAKAAVGPPDNYYESVVFVPAVAYRAS